jgi:hypothetical protein
MSWNRTSGSPASGSRTRSHAGGGGCMNFSRYGIDPDPKTVEVRMKALADEGLTPESFGVTDFQLRHHLDPSRSRELRELIKIDPIGRGRPAKFLPENHSETGNPGGTPRLPREILASIRTVTRTTRTQQSTWTSSTRRSSGAGLAMAQSPIAGRPRFPSFSRIKSPRNQSNGFGSTPSQKENCS